MKTKIGFVGMFLFLLIPWAFNQTLIPAGDVMGSWEASVSPYIIQGEITIPVDESLRIEPGVEVVFDGHYKLIIQGCLLAEGTESDSIVFTSHNPEIGWHGLRFIDTEAQQQPVSRVTYCVIEYGMSYGPCPDNRGAGIFVSHSNLIISNSCIRNNVAVSGIGTWGGGGIYCEYSSPDILNNAIVHNYSGQHGGGIYCRFGSPKIKKNIIENNEAAMWGGGIASFEFASPVISNNYIKDNSSGFIGGGIYQSGGNALIQSNVLFGNRSREGGGIACYLSDSRIFNNMIYSNNCGNGGAIWNMGSSPQIFNNTMVENICDSYAAGIYNTSQVGGGATVYSNPYVVNNIICSNYAEVGVQVYSEPGNTPILLHNDIGELEGGGISGDVDMQEGNIDVNPDFDILSDDIGALAESSGCIDKGINSVSGSSLPDADILGNKRIWDGDDDGVAYADMGAYEFNAPSNAINDQGVLCNMEIWVVPNPCIDNIDITIHTKSRAYIMLSVCSLLGENKMVLFNGVVNQGTKYLSENMDFLLPGIYFLNFRTNSGSSITKKIVKVK